VTLAVVIKVLWIALFAFLASITVRDLIRAYRQ
jgi:hypothetical protein